MLKNAAEIFLVLIAIGVIGLTLFSRSLNTHGYQLPHGWQSPSAEQMHNSSVGMGVCDRPMDTSGFPFAQTKPYYDSCFDMTNTTAQLLNNFISVAGWILVVVAVVTPAVLISQRTKKREKQ